MMVGKTFVVCVLLLIALSVYLFVTAPEPLQEEVQTGTQIPIEHVFAMVEAENDIVRSLWTKGIVGAGKKAGLKFDERWRENDVEAGPLPALFLRETATSLEKNPVRLGLYLGSDFPIATSNKFEGVQLEKFQLIRENLEPQFFLAEDTQLHTAMFDDIALAEPCVTCHNEHADSPKTDWKLNDVMGATTWSYPEASVNLDELMGILAALRKGFRDAYTAYITKVETFSEKPHIGEQWPSEGFFLPTPDVFMQEAKRRYSAGTLDAIMTSLDGNTSEQQAAVLRDVSLGMLALNARREE